MLSNLLKTNLEGAEWSRMKWLFKWLPEFLRVRIIRNKISIPVPPDDFQVRLATTREELEKAYSLLHQCYVDSKLMSPDPSGLRCNFYSFLPNTTTVIALIGDQVVGTLSLIKDSSAGLPSDKNFSKENDKLRKQGQTLMEVSSLAIDPLFRKKSHVVSLYLMKYLQRYATNYMGCSTVTCVVHPRAKDFYKAFWSFNANKKVIKYKFVNNALGVNVYGTIKDEHIVKNKKLFPSEDGRNPIEFIFKEADCLKFPPRQENNQTDPIYTPALLKYFLTERTDAISSLSRSEFLHIYSAYLPFFENLKDMEPFKSLGGHNLSERPFRYQMELPAKISDFEGTIYYLGKITDLSFKGAFLSADFELDPSKDYKLEFQINDESFAVNCRIAWRNRRVRGHQPMGFGIEFFQAQLGVIRHLKQTHLAVVKKKAMN